MPTYRLDIEYDGTKFVGWQVQARGRTVQGTLLEALRQVTGDHQLDLQGAGRTDAGVHALAQVASLRCRTSHDPGTLLREVNRALPADVAVLDVRRAAPGFHARHDAQERSYRYQLARRRSAFGKRTTWWVGEPLDAAAMRAAAASFVGRHDYAAFCKRSAAAGSTLVEVAQCLVAAVDELVLVRVVASHFLWHQVRRMVGSLVAVGRGEAGPSQVPLWLAGTAPPPALAAPAAGLFLEAVRYADEPWALPPMLPVGVPLRRSVAADGGKSGHLED